MSSEFLNKSGLSYFFGKIKEMLQNKQDKLTAGDNITITDNVISATAGDKNVYFATTQGATYEDRMYKVKVTLKDWKGNFGDILYLQFQNDIASTTALYMVINSENPKRIIVNASTSDVPGRLFRAHEVVGFVVDTNNRFQMLDHSTANTQYYGLTRLQNEIWDDATTAITPHAVQTALADKQDKLYAGDNITIGTDNKIEAYNKVYVGTCATSESEDVKEVSCPEWILAGGNIIVVNFVNGNMSSIPSLNVEGSGATIINWNNAKHMWQADSWIAFAFDENVNQFYAINMEKADDNKYGVVQLSDLVDMESGISDGRAATPFAVKKAYDLAQSAKEEAETGTKVFYGTCESGVGVAKKEVVCADWTLENGNVIVVRFATTNSASDAMYLNVNNTGEYPVGPITNPTYFWRSGGIVAFAFDEASSKYVMLNMGLATTGYYGVTRLSNAVNSTSQQTASTPYAVKQAYDLAKGKQDKLTAGNGITIQDNVISAEGGSHQQDLYIYDIQGEVHKTNGYKLTVSSSGNSAEYSGANAWDLTIKPQKILAPDFNADSTFTTTLACTLTADSREMDCAIDVEFTSYTNGELNCTFLFAGMFAEYRQSLTFTQYHKTDGLSTSITATQNSVF